MSQLSPVYKDTIVTFIVLIAVSISLMVVHYQNYAQGRRIAVKPVATATQILDADLAETIQVITSQTQAQTIFPDFLESVNWDKEALLAYISLPQPTPGFTAKLISAKRESNYLNIRYEIISPESSADTAIITVISYPTLLLIIPKIELASSSSLHIQFIEEATGHTNSLTIVP